MLDSVRWITSSGNILPDEENNVNINTKILPGKLRIIDQTRLPETLVYIETDDLKEIFDCIQRLAVRGAPAIGCAAALGLAAVSQHISTSSPDEFIREVRKSVNFLAKSRPTAVNLFWSMERCVSALERQNNKNIGSESGIVDSMKRLLVVEGLAILKEDIEMCRAIGKHGLKLLLASLSALKGEISQGGRRRSGKDGMRILTHCNAGALATGDYGTALSPIYTAHENGLNITVYADETRPLLQGSRLTAWELQKSGVSVITICDNMAAQVMKEGRIDMVIVGADRIAANGDSANKIGTYGVAVLAKYHNIPFYIAAPYSTIDISIPTGEEIPIEQRDGDEIRYYAGKKTSPENVSVYNPGFDVTPNNLITGIITEAGIISPPYKKNIKKVLGNKLHLPCSRQSEGEAGTTLNH